MFRFKLSTFVIHAAGWLLFLIFPLLFMNGGQKGTTTWILVFSSYYWLFCLTYISLFYFNTSYLIPKFFFKKKYINYGVIVLILFGCVYFLQPFDKLLQHNPRIQAQINLPVQLQPPSVQNQAIQGAVPGNDTVSSPSSHYPFGPLPHQDLRMQDPNAKSGIIPLLRHSQQLDVVSLVIFFIIMALSVAIRTVEQYQYTERKVVVAEAGKASAELSFLKAQINPHFLFNTLNNIYTLSVTNNEHTPDSIMKLSNIMRYVTDDVSEDFVRLQSEIDCLGDYISLQQLRLGSKTKVNFNISGNAGYQKIAPLILISFVENAFKYGISKQESSEIDININITDEEIVFYCGNKIFRNKASAHERTGIGIANSKQRLEQLYAQKHQLIISDDGEKFSVRLTLSRS
jgi:two-component system LytT family sensor kinase